MESYEPDGFKTLTIRADRATRTGELEGPRTLFLHDALTLVVTGVYGVDVTKVAFGVYSQAGKVISSVGAWAFVPNRTDAIYASVSLATGAAETLASTLTPGEEVPVWLSMIETGGRVILDMDMPFRRCLVATAGGSAGEISSYATNASLSALAATVAAMPNMNDYDRKRRFEVLLNGLIALST